MPDLCTAHCDTDGDFVADWELNLGVGGDEERGDLIGLVEMGEGLEAVVLRKTRAGGNWLTGGIVIMWCSAVLLSCVARSYGMRVRSGSIDHIID